MMFARPALSAAITFIGSVLIGTFFVPLSAAQPFSPLPPGTRYDPAVPTLESVVGHDFGEELTSPVQIEIYIKALAKAAPNRTRLVRYATSWEGRPLHMLIIASSDHMSSLDNLRAELQRLADPRNLPGDEAERLIDELPVVVALLHSTHGDEMSSSGAALAEAYHLLAAQSDDLVEEILAESIVIIDPVQNPDGRARFVFENLAARAAVPDETPQAAEHDEAWPTARTNHYLIDINRDWFAQTQPETRGKVKFLLEWLPHVVADLHEMGGDPRVRRRSQPYFFSPGPPPDNPYITAEQHALLELFGRANAADLDRRGVAYFTKEVFPAFNPGPASVWPLFHGATPMLFEMVSAHGLRFRRREGTLLTYGDGVGEHFAAALNTAKTAAQNRERILRDFLSYRRSAIDGGESPRAYLLPPSEDPGLTRRLAETLVRNGIEVGLAKAPVVLPEGTFPPGSFIVNLAQPASRMARTLLDPDITMDPEIVQTQAERLRRGLPAQIYGTAWNLPLFYDVDCIGSDRPIKVETEPLTLESFEARGHTSLPDAKVAYLLPWGSSTAALVAEAVRQGILVRVANEPFTLNGRTFGIGSAVIRAAELDDDLKAKLEELAARHDAEVVATDTGWPEGGVSLGSNQVRPLLPPRVLLAWDEPTNHYSAGYTRFVIERRFGQPVTIVRVGSLFTIDFSDYDVFVLPEGDYTRAVDADLLEELKLWMKHGGTMITIGKASKWAAREEVGLLGSTDPIPEVTQEVAPPFPIPGALLRVKLNREHWLSSGTDGEIQAMVNSERVFASLPGGIWQNVGVFESEDQLVASGVVWDESKARWAGTPYLMIQPWGRGQLVAFSEDPNRNAYSEATELLFMNAVLLGPVHLPVPGME
jgi:hypothetical protein